MLSETLKSSAFMQNLINVFIIRRNLRVHVVIIVIRDIIFPSCVSSNHYRHQKFRMKYIYVVMDESNNNPSLVKCIMISFLYFVAYKTHNDKNIDEGDTKLTWQPVSS